ncbi:hypothetical protein KI387_030460, partial [Taxus chinensis]
DNIKIFSAKSLSHEMQKSLCAPRWHTIHSLLAASSSTLGGTDYDLVTGHVNLRKQHNLFHLCRLHAAQILQSMRHLHNLGLHTSANAEIISNLASIFHLQGSLPMPGVLLYAFWLSCCFIESIKPPMNHSLHWSLFRLKGSLAINAQKRELYSFTDSMAFCRISFSSRIWELGIGIVPYSPLGRGFFSGKAVVEKLPENSSLAYHPRFKGENLVKNKVFYTRIADLAKKHGCTPGQLALAWVLQQGDDVVPIPGEYHCCSSVSSM